VNGWKEKKKLFIWAKSMKSRLSEQPKNPTLANGDMPRGPYPLKLLNLLKRARSKLESES